MASVEESLDAYRSRIGEFIDVRNADEFGRGHVPGALFMPLPVVPLRVDELDRSRTYYVICESGARSWQASAFLAQRGYDARSVDGGMAALRVRGIPLESGLPNSSALT